jgi:acyl-CoA reductase-like NAD-dependent aldehyde dehydrogenase
LFDNWIDGEQCSAASGRRFERLNPFDGTTASSFANSDRGDAELAIAAARRAFDKGSWPHTSARRRFEVLSRAAELLAQRTAEFTDRMVLESGKPVSVAQGKCSGR